MCIFIPWGWAEMIILGKTLFPLILCLGAQVLAACAGDSFIKAEGPCTRLKPCPGSPNCVSSESKAHYEAIAPMPFTGSPEDAVALLAAIINDTKRSTITTVSGNYLHAEFRSLLGFVDDAEFYVDHEHAMIQMRSASRIGYWDLGVNRRRLEAIRAAFNRASAKTH
jgi:uncharacterized protein (DUF1499 family)